MTEPRPAYGRTLYALLPEIYRQRDAHEPAGDPGHLLRYLDSHGLLLDLVRGTLEQMYADHFPDVPDAGRSCQAWIVPYLADLVGTTPVSPFADGQRDEVANAIRWSKRKGTFVAVQDIVEKVARSETELQEGWKRVIVSARPDDIVLPATFFGLTYSSVPSAIPRVNDPGPSAPNPIDAVLANPDSTAPFTSVNPQVAARHPGLRAATIDTRVPSRAIQAQPGEMGARATRFNTALSNWPRDDNAPAAPTPAPTGWRQYEPHGAPCFPDSYEDVSQRTVDVRTGDAAGVYGRYHPKTLIIYMPPPFGLCPPLPSGPLPVPLPDPPPNPPFVTWPVNDGDWDNHPYLERIVPSDDNPGLLIIRNKTAASVLVQKDLTNKDFTIGPAGDIALAPGVTLQLEKLRFDGTLTLAAGSVVLKRCAVREFALATDSNSRSLSANSVLFSRLSGGYAGDIKLTGNASDLSAIKGNADDVELEYCTILDQVATAADLKASEVIFPDGTPGDSIACARYSRLPLDVLDPKVVRLSPATNTGAAPLFVSDVFGMPGAGVLRPDANPALLNGAEDGAEMGAFHDWRYEALRRAILRKLTDYLPLGIVPMIAWDVRLLITPPVLKTS